MAHTKRNGEIVSQAAELTALVCQVVLCVVRVRLAWAWVVNRSMNWGVTHNEFAVLAIFAWLGALSATSRAVASTSDNMHLREFLVTVSGAVTHQQLIGVGRPPTLQLEHGRVDRDTAVTLFPPGQPCSP
jgi:hypothetical protein